MSPRGGKGGGHPEGSGPGGQITPDDIRAKAEQLAGGVEDQIERSAPSSLTPPWAERCWWCWRPLCSGGVAVAGARP